MKHEWFARAAKILPAVAMLFAAGCSTTAMKGTPFYTGEYAKRSGPAEDRVNLWPLAYYRDPALSLLWPVFEHVEEEHLALRPVFSVYDLNKPGAREWNVLWPFFQYDQGTHDGRVAPLLWWGEDYFTVFPVLWHMKESSRRREALFPLWWYYRDSKEKYLNVFGGLGGRVEDRAGVSWWAFPLAGDLRYDDGEKFQYALWPLAQRRDGANEHSSMIFPLWYAASNSSQSTFLSLPWSQGSSRDGSEWEMAFPFYFSKHGPGETDFFTLLGGSWSNASSSGWAIPPALSWHETLRDRSDWWLAAGLAHIATGPQGGGSYAFPLFYRDSRDDSFVSLPYAQWTERSNTTYCVPLLASSFTPKPDGYESRALLFFTREVDRKRDQSSTWLFPVFGHDNYGPIDRQLVVTNFDRTGSEFWCLPACWRDNTKRSSNAPATSVPHIPDWFEISEFSHGIFPLWSYTDRSDSRGHADNDFSILLFLYDRDHEIRPRNGAPNGTNDYVRQRVLWRVWHHERLNGDVSMDMLPGITYDAHADGFRKYSLLWRVFRWQRDADGKRKLDLLFLPLIRD